MWTADSICSETTNHEGVTMDKIYIRDLCVRCIIGIYPQERTDKQDVVINIVLEGDLSSAGRSDDIADTINYKTIKKRVLKLVEKSSFFLVEKLAEEIAVICLKEKLVRRVTVTLDKPGALRFARSVAVEITRDKK
jgi:dihydroneopterin aldolase/D-erythro-7,8-dihydroneopterin triphosphate epimerase